MKTKQIQICLFILTLLLPAIVRAQFYYTNGVDIYQYTATAGNITITAYLGSGSDVTIPDTINFTPVTGIGYTAFDGTSVAGIMLGNNITNISAGAFTGCPDLLAIIVNADNPAYSDVEGVLFDKNQSALIAFPGGIDGSYLVPNSVTKIEDHAFDQCTNLTNVTIPNSVKNIGVDAFASCSSLANITIPNSVTNIGDYAFYNCTGLTGITMPDKVTSMGEGIFEFCFSLTNATIPNGVTSIGYVTFYGCISLTGVTIPNSVTNIGEYAFGECHSLTGVTIPSSVTSIGGLAFAYCYSLTGAYFRGNAPNQNFIVFTEVNSAAEAYYLPTTTGWSADFCGLTTSLYFPDSLLTNGNFETIGFMGWNTNGEITITNDSHTGFYAAQIGGRNPGSLTQTLPTQVGQAYMVSFWMSSEFGGSVSWNGNGLGIPNYVSTNWVNYQFAVIATGTNTVLVFSTPGASVLQTTMIVDDVSVMLLADYDQINAQLVNGGGVQLSFQGLGNTEYALDRTFNLSPPITWVPQSTNATGSDGILMLTNTPVPATNNFWRMRSVP